MGKKDKRFLSIFIRYLILILVALPNLGLFYIIFSPLTIHLVNFTLNLFFETFLTGTTIILEGRFPIEIIPACIAGSAYYLLLILNLSISKVELAKRIKMILLAFFLFYLVNVSRIVILSMILLANFKLFVISHQIFWYAMSTVFVAGIWFLEVKLFRIKEIPFYSDFKFLVKKSELFRK